MRKYLLILMLIIITYGGMFFFGTSVGYNKSQTEFLKGNFNQLEILINDVQSVDEKLNRNSLVQEEIKVQLQNSQRNTTREVIDYAQKSVSAANCLDDEWVQLYNKSNASAIPGSTNTSKIPNSTTGTSGIKEKSNKR